MKKQMISVSRRDVVGVLDLLDSLTPRRVEMINIVSAGRGVELVTEGFGFVVSVRAPVLNDWPFNIEINGQRLRRLLKSMADEIVYIEFLDNALRIKSELSAYTIAGRQPLIDDRIESNNPVGVIDVAAARSLANAITAVSTHASRATTTSNLSCVRLVSGGGCVRVEATDGRRAAIRHVAVSSLINLNHSIQLEFVVSVARLLTSCNEDCLVELFQNAIEFRSSAATVFVATSSIEMPDLERLIPPPGNQTRVSRAAMIEAIARLMIYASDPAKIEFTRSSDGLLMRVKSDVADAVERINCDAPEFDAIMVNGAYMLDAVRAVVGDEIEIEFREAHDPIVVRGDNSICLVMPMRF